MAPMATKEYFIGTFSLVFVSYLEVIVPDVPFCFVFIFGTVLKKEYLVKGKSQETAWTCLCHMVTTASKEYIDML